MYLKFAIRSLWNNRMYSLITLVGIAVGITCLQLAILFAEDEHRFDAFHGDGLYRITMHMAAQPGQSRQTTGGTGQVQGPAFAARIPDIEASTRVMGGDIYGDVRGPRGVHKLQLLYVDANFLRTFRFRVIEGSPATALSHIHSVVLTERTARRYFGNSPAVGQRLQIDDDPSAQKLGRPLVVTAVVENPPAQSSLQFDLLHPFAFLQLSFEDPNWNSPYLSTFVRLRPGAGIPEAVHLFDRVHRQHAAPGPEVHYGLQPLADIHLNPLYNAQGNLKDRISPVVLFAAEGYQSGIWVKAAPGKRREAVAALERAYRKVLPQTLFEYQFPGDLLAHSYEQDRRWQQLVGYATLLSVFICCSGLFALITFATRQRTREIGIRKVLGASAASLAALLSREFLWLTGLAFVLAAPVSAYLMGFWLDQFAYHISLRWTLFAAAGAGAFFLTLLTVGLRGWLAALADPVRNLRTE